MNNADLPPALNIYQESALLLADLDDNDAGQILKAAVTYFFTGELPDDLSSVLYAVFNRIREGLDYSLATWQKRSKAGSTAANKRWHGQE